jgi:hypothetical protein
MERVEELTSGDQVRIHRERRENEKNAHQPSKAVAKQLRAEEREDADAGVRAHVVVQVLRGEDADGEGGRGRRGSLRPMSDTAAPM